VKLLFAAALVASVSVAGCATPPPPVDTSSTTVVLLPDEDGNVGAILVSNASGTEKIDKAYTSTIVDSTHKSPSEGSFVGEPSIDQQYAELLSAQPHKPASFILYFALGSTELTPESKAMLPAVLRTAKDRKPTEISVFGYADATGTDKRNDRLSQERAEAIAQALRKFAPDVGPIDVEYFGARQPLIPTPANVPEARNRRAEIMIL
jgi:outer membrane protein OmpA-like peptidoglycan-associated protein